MTLLVKTITEKITQREKFKIVEVLPKKLPLYKIADLKGNLILGTFYEAELLLARRNMNDDFYMLLCSNNSLKYFPDNKSNHFVTVLPHEINLPSTFKFALIDFLQPPSETESTAIINYINCSMQYFRTNN